MSTLIVTQDNSILITTEEISQVIAGPTEVSSLITSTDLGPQGISAYQVAVENGFTGTESEWIDSLMGNPRDLVVTKGVTEIAVLTVDFSYRLAESDNITAVNFITAEPSLTISDISFTAKTVVFEVSGGTLHSGHRLTINAQTTLSAGVPATIYLLNI